MKPKQYECENYCDQYPCDKVNCDMKKLIRNNKFIMKPKAVCDYFDTLMKRRLYRESRECKPNGMNFKREKLI